MADFNETLARLLRLTIGTNGYLDKQTARVVERTAITVDEYIDRRLASGATPEAILTELYADLDADISRIFGEFKNGMTDAVYGAANIAGTNGSVAKLLETTSPEERGTRLFRWQAAGGNVCEDCEERHGQEDTLEGWTVRGLPKLFGSRCGHNCRCELVGTDVIMEPITLGARIG